MARMADVPRAGVCANSTASLASAVTTARVVRDANGALAVAPIWPRSSTNAALSASAPSSTANTSGGAVALRVRIFLSTTMALPALTNFDQLSCARYYTCHLPELKHRALGMLLLFVEWGGSVT